MTKLDAPHSGTNEPGQSAREHVFPLAKDWGQRWPRAAWKTRIDLEHGIRGVLQVVLGKFQIRREEFGGLFAQSPMA